MTATWHTRYSSRALIPFTKGESLPYTSEDGVRVTAIKPREGVAWGHPHNNGRTMHLIRDLAGAWTPGGLRVGARWLCGKGSIGVDLYIPEAYWERVGACYLEGTDPDDIPCRKCRDVRDGITERPVVYRTFDKRGALLYIGSTKNWESRRSQHRAQTWWWAVVKDVELEHHDSLADARAAEAAAIKAERPRLNVMHNRETA